MLSTASLIFELLNLAPDLERKLGAEWPKVRDKLVDLASRIDLESNMPSLRNDVDALLEQLIAGPAGEILQRNLLGAEQPLARLLPPDQPIAVHDSAQVTPDGIVYVPVFYATSRQWNGGENKRSWYASDRADLSYGIAQVSIPTHHVLGELEAPRWWRFEFRENPLRHFVLLKPRRLHEDEFIAHTAAACEPVGSLLLFIHGYNVSFENAARRAAQLAVDLKCAGPVLLYCELRL